MENSIISNFKKRIDFLKKKIICFVNVKTDPRLGYSEVQEHEDNRPVDG
jgi:hypothetical protein